MVLAYYVIPIIEDVTVKTVVRGILRCIIGDMGRCKRCNGECGNNGNNCNKQFGIHTFPPMYFMLYLSYRVK